MDNLVSTKVTPEDYVIEGMDNIEEENTIDF